MYINDVNVKKNVVQIRDWCLFIPAAILTSITGKA